MFYIHTIIRYIYNIVYSCLLGVRIVRRNKHGEILESVCPTWKQNIMSKLDVLDVTKESQKENEDEVPGPLSITHFAQFAKLAGYKNLAL